jgi:hypothetical protein
VFRLSVLEWVKETDSEHRDAASGTRKWKLIGRPSDEMSRVLMALVRKQCRLVTGC